MAVSWGSAAHPEEASGRLAASSRVDIGSLGGVIDGTISAGPAHLAQVFARGFAAFVEPIKQTVTVAHDAIRLDGCRRCPSRARSFSGNRPVSGSYLRQELESDH